LTICHDVEADKLSFDVNVIGSRKEKYTFVCQNEQEHRHWTQALNDAIDLYRADQTRRTSSRRNRVSINFDSDSAYAGLSGRESFSGGGVGKTMTLGRRERKSMQLELEAQQNDTSATRDDSALPFVVS
jgi:hypothetical protein